MKRKWIRVLALLTVFFGMAWTLSFPGGAAEPVDLEAPCSLTVKPGAFTEGGSDYLAEQQEKAGIVVDLYKLGDAVPDRANGFTYDGYQYELAEQYREELTLSDGMTNGDWQELAQKAARVVLGITVDPDTGEVSGKALTEPDRAGEPVGQRITELDAGLYLMIARGAGEGLPEDGYRNVADYVAVSRNDGIERISTTVNSPECVFSFEPELISLPGKDPYTDAEGNQVSNTANPGPWRYHMEPVLKPHVELRYGSLQITKILPDFEAVGGTPKPVTFIFEVHAEWEDKIGGRGERKEYNDVVAIDFRGAGTQNVYRPGEEIRLPVGAAVTVKEVYSGSGYQPYPEGVTDEEAQRRAYEQTVVIGEAEQSFGVTFTNYYHGRNVDGHGITNQFVYSAEENRWIWTSVHADGTLGGESRQPESESQQPENGTLESGSQQLENGTPESESQQSGGSASEGEEGGAGPQ
ncbi:MAG: hypothetical protein NC432_02315 [Roseburia sp.]|nr:hypothetical protein [Roseburia sp.]MCM1097474.1 hypothetical protein [Ruminococcus flavefaciens]